MKNFNPSECIAARLLKALAHLENTASQDKPATFVYIVTYIEDNAILGVYSTAAGAQKAIKAASKRVAQSKCYSHGRANILNYDISERKINYETT